MDTLVQLFMTTQKLQLMFLHCTTVWSNNNSKHLRQGIPHSLNKDKSGYVRTVLKHKLCITPGNQMSGRWLISSSLQQLRQEGGGETVRQKIERRERTRMQLGRREKDKQHVWASNHQLTLFICCVVSVSPSTHRGFVWTHQNSQKKQSERKK